MEHKINNFIHRLSLGYRLYSKGINIRSIKHILMAMVRRRFRKFSSPYSVLLGVTYNCQFHCRFCGVGGQRQAGQNFLLSDSEIRKLISELADLGVLHVCFTGGEPILRDGIFEFISYAAKRGMVVSMDSNGLEINNRNAARLKRAGLTLVKVSLHSPDASWHDNIVNFKGAFENAVSAVENALSAGLACIFSTVITKGLMNNSGLYRLISLGTYTGAMALKIELPAFAGNLLQSEYDAFTEEELACVRKACDFRFAYYSSVLSDFLKCSCLSKSNCYISPKGEVKTCMFLPLTFGNIKNESFRDIWVRMICNEIYNYSVSDCYGENKNFREKYFLGNYPGKFS